ncbi:MULTISPECIES: hypothetical protein [Pseudomonas]|uniref:hypothetical protein n=1 Tax=Pseudomonas TaxID=286 RepID=UPI001E579C14|nr:MULTISPECIES: hypothetical protein [Pseudomonas]
MKAREFEQYQSTDTLSRGRNTPAMNAISREEFNARIETIEARMDARVERVHADIREFLGSQTERDKAIERIQFERDKRYESMIQGIAIESREALKKAGTVNANVWMATAVYLFGVVSIVVGGYFASQAHLYVAAQTTLAAVQAGKDVGAAKPAELPSLVLPK